MNATRIREQEYTHVDIESVKPHPHNPNEGDVGAIHTMIQHNGFYGAIVVQKDTRLILAGNHRWMAAKHAGLSEIPAFILDVDDVTALEIMVGDNRASALATTKEDVLTQTLARIKNETDTLLGTGFDDEDLNTMIAKLHSDGTDLPDTTTGRRKAVCPGCGHEFMVD